MNFLSGYKTYIVAIAGILTALGAYASGEMSLGNLVEAIYAGLTAMALRAGIAKNNKK